jgi:hypothetical protein
MSKFNKKTLRKGGFHYCNTFIRISAMAKKTNDLMSAADLDNDGILTSEELDVRERILNIQDRDAMRDAQRRMAWAAVLGMLIYPVMIVLAVWLKLDGAAEILGDISSTYFLSVAAIAGAFYGGQAYTDRKKN